MAWEIESTEWHLSPFDHTRTVERAAAFVAAGVIYTATLPAGAKVGRLRVSSLKQFEVVEFPVVFENVPLP